MSIFGFSESELNGSSWSRIFSMENIDSYASAVINLYGELYDLEDKGYQSLVFPSRGTTPFKDLFFSVHRAGVLPPRSSNSFINAINSPFSYRTISLPFTADPPENFENGSADIRGYWVRVLKALLVGDRDSVELRYYQYCLSHIFGLSSSHGAPIHEAGEKFVFVDTVVSGRAVCEIVDSFEENALDNFFLLLIVDQSGRGLKGEYKAKLDAMVSAGKAKLIFVLNLFTEDRGPAMTSTWCLSVPQLVERGGDLFEGRPQLCGTAVSFVRVQHDPKLGNLSSTVLGGTLGTLLHTAVQRSLSPKVYSHGYRVLDFMRYELISKAMRNEAGGFNPLDPKETLRISKTAVDRGVPVAVQGRSLGLRIVDMNVSGSHVVRLIFDNKQIGDFIDGFRKSSHAALLSTRDLE